MKATQTPVSPNTLTARYDRELDVITARLTAGRDTPAVQTILASRAVLLRADRARHQTNRVDPFARLGSVIDDGIF